MIDARQAMLDDWAALINAPFGSIFAAENVTQTVSNFIGALPDRTLRGRRVLIAEDCFPSLHFLLRGLSALRGFELVTVPLREDAAFIEDEDFIAHWDSEVAVALITYVSSTASKRADIETLVQHGRTKGSLIAVDITQAVGILPIDVIAMDADLAVATSLKWLSGVPGAGLAYLRRELLTELEPTLRGWFSQPDPFNWAIDAFTYAPDARRFDNGTPSYLPFIASHPGLKWTLAQTVPAARARNLTLSAALIDIADSHQLPLLSPKDDAWRGGSVMVRIPDHINATSLQVALMAQGIVTDTRGQCMRWSPGSVTADSVSERLDRALAHALPRS